MRIKVMQEIEIEIPKFWKNEAGVYMLTENGHVQIKEETGYIKYFKMSPLDRDLEGLKEITKEQFRIALDNALNNCSDNHLTILGLLNDAN